MKPGRRSFLSMLDDTVRWTGMPDRVADQLSDDPDRKHRPSRWFPICPIALSCALLLISVAWPPVLNVVSSSFVLGVLTSFLGGNIALMSAVHMNGPLGKSSFDERESSLSRNSFVFCLGLLALLNGLGQPVLMILSHWQKWGFAQTASVVMSALVLNFTLLGCVPTLYASWTSRPLPND